METREAYNEWAAQYDTNENKTRDLEAKALREILEPVPFTRALEIGCGTGKNTGWLITKGHVTGVDLSEGMLAKAREKVPAEKAEFRQADITAEWNFGSHFDLVTYSLVLEHIENLGPVFEKTAGALKPGGHVYIGELHPFKQYAGSKARFETEEGLKVVDCYTHHISDFVNAAAKSGLQLLQLNEYFDENEPTGIPRILCLLFKKQ